MIKRLYLAGHFLVMTCIKLHFSREWFPKILDCWDDGQIHVYHLSWTRKESFMMWLHHCYHNESRCKNRHVCESGICSNFCLGVVDFVLQ